MAAQRMTGRRRMAWMATASALAVAPVVAMNAGGCAGGPASTQPSTPEQRQAAALKDPMNYKPGVESTPDVSDPSGLSKDPHDLFNP